MRKLISFCLHGTNDRYCRGFFENIPLAKEFYPGWEVVLFHDNTVPSEWLAKYEEAGVEMHNVYDCGLHPTAYRFLAQDLPDVERFISRDADSRLSQREAEAVKEWEDSGMGLHSMRDHPHHNQAHHPIFAGMFGVVTNELENSFNMLDSLLAYQGGKRGFDLSRGRRHSDWGIDQSFLRDIIYPVFFNGQSIIIHASYDKRFDFEKDFPSPRNEHKNFVGEIFDYRHGKRIRHPQWKEL
tara:strand:+ start:22 stop:741 length:720 start_codon:yes stop_codon:yes gene_type:complete